MVSPESEVDLLQLPEAAYEQSRADEQCQRQRHLDDDEDLPDSLCAPAVSSPGSSPHASPFFERLTELKVSCLKRGRQPEDQTREQREYESEREYTPVETNVFKPWEVGRDEIDQQSQAPPGQQCTQRPTQD